LNRHIGQMIDIGYELKPMIFFATFASPWRPSP